MIKFYLGISSKISINDIFCTKKINKKKLQVVTISFDFSMKIYGYTGFYLCRMPSAPLNLNNITLDLSLFLSVSIFWYFYEIVLLFMLFFFMSVLSANLNLNNITRQILIRVYQILICRISGLFFAGYNAEK